MNKNQKKTCPICGKTYEGYGNNPDPLNIEGNVCDTCNIKVIIPIRILLLNQNKKH